MRKSPNLIPTFLLIFGIISTSSAQKQKPPNPVGPDPSEDNIVRVETTLVTIPVGVRDRKGRFILSLSLKDFRLYEDGVEQEIAYFESPGETINAPPNSPEKPFTIALLIDASDSTEFKLEQIQRTAIAFVNLLRRGDRVIIVAFDKRVQVLAEATNDRNVLGDAIRRTRSGGGTSLYAALDTVLNERLSRLGGRKAVVLLTDGVDTASKGSTAESTIRAAEESDASIFPIQFSTYADFADNPSRETFGVGNFGGVAHVTRSGEPASEAYKRATLYLRRLAQKTGGHFQYADTAKNLALSFERIAAQLRQQYTLGYYPSNKATGGKQRQIRVDVSLPKVDVRTRKGYVYKSLNH